MHEQPCRSPADCLYLFPPFYPTSFIRIVITTYNCTRSLNGSTTAIHSRYPFLYLPHVLSKQRYEPIQSSFQIEPQNPFHISRQPFFLVSSEAKGATSRDGACFLPVRNGRRFGGEGGRLFVDTSLSLNGDESFIDLLHSMADEIFSSL